MISEYPDCKKMFLKYIGINELGSLPKIKGGIQVKPLRRKDPDEMPDMELIIDPSKYNVRAGEIGLKLPHWSNVEFTTSPTRLVIDIPDSDEEDMCHRNEDHSARLAMTRLDPKLLDKTSPFVDGIVSSDGRSLTVRAVFNKDANPSSCGPEIEMMGLGNWNIVNPTPDLDVDVFQSSANYDIRLGKLQLDENELPRDTVLLQKESLEDQVALRPIEVPNVDLAFNFGQDIGPEDRWKFSAKCQKSGLQSAVPLEDYVLKPRETLKVAAGPHLFGVQSIEDSYTGNKEGLENLIECSSPRHQKTMEQSSEASQQASRTFSITKLFKRREAKCTDSAASVTPSISRGPFAISSKESQDKESH